MGVCRFILAVLVLISHAGMMIMGYNTGVFAVVVFLIISGFTMNLLLSKYYNSPKLVKGFYLDRVARIFPQFIFYLILTVIYVSINQNLKHTFVTDFSFIKVIENFFILPLGYYMYLDLSNCLLIPPAWTLGLELTFYIIFPLIFFRKNKKVLIFCILASMVISMLACFNILNSDYFGYRLIFGTLFIFLAGALIQGVQKKEIVKKIILSLIWLFSLSLYIFLLLETKYQAPYNKEVMLGVLVGIPLIYVLRKQKLSKLNSFLGDMSYGVYLNHYLLILVLGKPKNIVDFVILIGASVALAFVSNSLIEKPIQKIRRRFRENNLVRN